MLDLIESFSVEEWKRWTPAMQTLLHVLVILILAWLLYRFVDRLLKRFRTFMSMKVTSSEEVKRIETLGRVFHYVASVVITVVTGMLVLSELGVSIAPILGAAGVVGVAVGFGAQSLVKDYFTGLFLLLENQVRQGDVVQVAGKDGEVEELTLRYMRLRDGEGSVHYIPNGLITTVTNKSRDFAYAVVDVSIAYKENIDNALDVMRTVGNEMRNDPAFSTKILENFDTSGVESIGNSGVTLRGRFKVRTPEQWDVKRELIKRLKLALDAHGIEMPFPHLKVYMGQSPEGSTAPGSQAIVAKPTVD